MLSSCSWPPWECFIFNKSYVYFYKKYFTYGAKRNIPSMCLMPPSVTSFPALALDSFQSPPPAPFS
jgi:hypothetical protein